MQSKAGRVWALLLAAVLVAVTPAMGQAAEEGHGKSEKGDKKEAGKAENGAITLGPLVVNVLSRKGYRYFRLSMVVQCDDNAAAERLLKPDAREDLVLSLSTKMAEDLLTPAGKMVLRKELMELFNKYAAPGKVQEIYFTEFVFQ